MNIFQTFEIFLREPLSILRERFIQIVSVNSAYVTQPSVNVDFTDKQAQITVVNSEKMYNLFQTVLYKQKIKKAQNFVSPSGNSIPLLGLTASGLRAEGKKSSRPA